MGDVAGRPRHPLRFAYSAWQRLAFAVSCVEVLLPSYVKSSALGWVGPIRSDGVFDATFVLWRRPSDARWQAGTEIDLSPADVEETDPDGSWLLDVLSDDIATRYIEYAAEVFQAQLNRAAAEHVVTVHPLAEPVVQALNANRSWSDVRSEASRLEFPVASAPSTSE